MILIPVKNLEEAKQRLSAVLSAAERRRLAEAMLEDVLSTLAVGAAGPPVVVVTSDPGARQLARRFSFDVIEDTVNQGESAAIALASEVCGSPNGSGNLVLPGDIPLLQVSEVERIYAAAPVEGAVLVPSFDGRGTNAVLRRPAGLFPLTFGGESFPRHLGRARATGRPWVALQLPGVALDVDTPEDLGLLLAAEGESRAQQLLREWKVAERLLAPPRAGLAGRPR
ncbi:MAG: 2-phospho-L-lactate guanylyltransferase [Candidatus Acidoferrales bacterium]